MNKLLSKLKVSGLLLLLSHPEKIVLALLICLLAATLSQQPALKANTAFPPASKDGSIKPNQLFDPSNIENYTDLPVGKIEQFPVQNSVGTVFFIPQFHKNPGSSASEKINDSAKKAQEQIYQILSFLISKSVTSLVVTEGELYGEVPTEKIAFLTQKVEQRNTLSRTYLKLKEAFAKEGLSKEETQRFIEALDKELARIDREIILEGAPFKLKAEGVNLVLFGAENKETREKSKILVRDYLYLQDRLSQVQTSANLDRSYAAGSLDPTNPISFGGDKYKELLELLSYKPTGPDFSSVEKLARSQGKQNLAEIIQETKAAFTSLHDNRPQKALVSAPSRQDNPYKNITDKESVQHLINQQESAIEKIVVDQRNKETAQNFLKALADNHQASGILQFGAGHAKGLIEELNKVGLSVIMIAPEEILKRKSGLE